MSSIRDEFRKTVEDRRRKMEENGATAALECLGDVITQLNEAGVNVTLTQDSEGRLPGTEYGRQFGEAGDMPRYLLTIEDSATYGLYFGRGKDDSYSKVSKFGITQSTIRANNTDSAYYCTPIEISAEKLRQHIMKLAATYHICNESLPGSHAKNRPENMVRKFKPGG